MSQIKIKQKLFNQCEAFVNKRLQTVEEIISSNQKALQSETKSSAGDKHETGRAMMQLEMEKAGQQLSGIRLMKATLSKVDLSNNEISGVKIAHLGSIIETNSINYFLAISAGQLIVSGEAYFAISVLSPIGRLLLGKTVGEAFSFNGKTNRINRIT